MNPFDYVLQGDVDYLKQAPLEVLLNSRDEEGDSLLSKAVRKQDLSCVEVIYERCPELLYCENAQHLSALHHAAPKGNLEILKFIINADIESQGKGAKKRLTRMPDFYGQAGLMVAVQWNMPEAVKLLYAADPDFHHPPNNANQTPLKLCFDLNMQEMFKLLLETSPAQSKTRMGPNGWTILHYAASEGDLSAIKDIIRLCPDCWEVVDNKGHNFLHIAAQFGKVDAVRLCIAEQKDISTNAMKGQDNNGWTPLHHAAFLGNSNVVMEIIHFCPDCLELVDNKGMNFFHVAAKFGRIQVVKHVLASKKMPDSVLNMKDSNGNTPLHIAVLSDTAELARCILYDSNVNKWTVNNYGQPVLQAITFDYDKRKAGVRGLMSQVDPNDLKEQSEFDLLVGALIATVSFTSGITVPGGYISDGPNKGSAVLTRKIAFRVFIISNAMALLLSLYAVFSHYCTRNLIKTHDVLYQLNVAKYCTLGALYAMVTAFIAGSFTVLEDSIGLAISVCAICCCFYILATRPIMKIVIQERDGSRRVATPAGGQGSRTP